MRKIGLILMAVMLSFNASASEIKGEDLQLSAEQNQKLIELKNNLKEEVRPVLEEIESRRQHITEIERKYFEEFWNMLSEEQKQKFAELNQ